MTKEIFLQKVSSDPPENCTTTLSDGARFIPIERLEPMLDEIGWSTKNYNYDIFKDGYANLCVAASIELIIGYTNENGGFEILTFVGACSFSLKSIDPNTHFLATAKSECIKNAASDIGKYYGRGLNTGLVPSATAVEKRVVKSRPDSKIMKQFLASVEAGDTATQIMLSNVYEINIEKEADNVEEK